MNTNLNSVERPSEPTANNQDNTKVTKNELPDESPLGSTPCSASDEVTYPDRNLITVNIPDGLNSKETNDYMNQAIKDYKSAT